MILAALLAAEIAAAEPPRPEGVVAGGPGAVVQGIGQGAVIETPRFRPAGVPTAGKPPVACTVVAGFGNRILLRSGCVFIESGVGNSVNGKVFPAGSKVCVGRRGHPSLCGTGWRFPRL